MLKTRRKKEKSSKRSKEVIVSRNNTEKPGKLANDLQYLFEAMQKYSKRHWFNFFENAECVKCSEVHKLMITVGALKFCTKCFEVEFDSKAKERDIEVYKRWYRVFEEKINMAFEGQDTYEMGGKANASTEGPKEKGNKKEEKSKLKLRRKSKKA